MAEIQAASRDVIRGSFDTISRTTENARHWSWIDYSSADASLNSTVRKQIRAQARYELQENNSLGKGICLTLVGDTVGTGPRLQMQLGSERENSQIEEAWTYWASAVDLREKLSTMRMAKLVDGESICRLVNNSQSQPS